MGTASTPSATSRGGGAARTRLRFDDFELDPRSGELWRRGLRVPLQQQPFRVLECLAGRPREVVTREELRRELWGERVHVDFEAGLNFCVKQLRAALGDSAASPRYVETLPRRGYRWLASIEPVDCPGAGGPGRPSNGTRDVVHTRPTAGLAVGAVLFAGSLFLFDAPRRTASRVSASTRRGVVGEDGLSPGSREALLSARYLLHKARREDGARAIKAFEAVVASDPQASAGHGGLALAHVLAATRAGRPADASLSAARTSSDRALALDPAQPDAHLARAILALYFDHEPEAARRAFEAAVRADPGDARIHHWFAGCHSALGNDEDALAEVEAAARLDPLSSLVVTDVGFYHYQARRYEDAAAHLERAVDLEPDDSNFARQTLADALARLARFDRARDEALALMERVGASPEWIARVAERQGEPAFREYLAWRSEPTDPEATNEAFLALAWRGRREEALVALEEMQRARWPWLVAFLRDPALDSLRAEPRFQDLRRRLGLAPVA